MASMSPQFHYVYVAGTGAVLYRRACLFQTRVALTGRYSKVVGTVISLGKSSFLQESLMSRASPP